MWQRTSNVTVQERHLSTSGQQMAVASIPRCRPLRTLATPLANGASIDDDSARPSTNMQLSFM